MSNAVRSLFSGDKKKKPPLPPKPKTQENSRPPKVPQKPAFITKLLRVASIKGSSKDTGDRKPRLRRSDGEDDEVTEESNDFKDIDFGAEVFDFTVPVDHRLPANRTVSTAPLTSEAHDEILTSVDFNVDNLSLDEPTIRVLLSNPDFMATIAAMDEEAAAPDRLAVDTEHHNGHVEVEENESVTPVASPEPEEANEDDAVKEGVMFGRQDTEEWQDAVDEDHEGRRREETPVPAPVPDGYYEPVAKPGEALMARLNAELADYKPPKKALVGDPFAWRQMSLERFKGYGECFVGHDPPPSAYDRIERDYNAIELKLSRTTGPTLAEPNPPRSPVRPPVPPRPRGRSERRSPPPPPPRKPRSPATPGSEDVVGETEAAREDAVDNVQEVFEEPRRHDVAQVEGKEEAEAPSAEGSLSAEELQPRVEEVAPQPRPRTKLKRRFLSADTYGTVPRRGEKSEENGAIAKRVDNVRVWIPRRSRSFHSADEIRKKIDVQAQIHLRMPRKGRESSGTLSREGHYCSSTPVYSVVKKDYSRIWKTPSKDGYEAYKGPLNAPAERDIPGSTPPPELPKPYEDDPTGAEINPGDVENPDPELEPCPTTTTGEQPEVIEEPVVREDPPKVEEVALETAEEVAPQTAEEVFEEAVEQEIIPKVEVKVEGMRKPERKSRPLPAPPPPPRPRHRSKKSEASPTALQPVVTDAVFSVPKIPGGSFDVAELHVFKLRVSELEASKITAHEIEASRIRGMDVEGVRGGNRYGGGNGGGSPGGSGVPPKSWSDKESQTESRRPKPATGRGSEGPAAAPEPTEQLLHRVPADWDLSSQTDSQTYVTCDETIHGSDMGGEAEDDDSERRYILGWMKSSDLCVESDGSAVGSDNTEVREVTPPPIFKVPVGGVAVLPALNAGKALRRSSDTPTGLRRCNAQRRKTTINVMPETSCSAPTTPQMRHTLRATAGWRFDGVDKTDSSGSSVEGSASKLQRNPGQRTWVDEGEAPGNLADNDNDVSDSHGAGVPLRQTGGNGEDSDAEGTASMKKRLSSLFGGSKESRRKEYKNTKSKFYVEEPTLPSPVDLLKKIAMTTEAVASYVADVVDDDVNNNNNDVQAAREPQQLLELPQDGVHRRASSEESAVISEPSEEHEVRKGNSFEMSDDSVEERPGVVNGHRETLTVPGDQSSTNRILSFRESTDISSEDDDDEDYDSETEVTDSSSSKSAPCDGGIRKRNKAFNVAQEMMSSECVFVEVLRLLNEDFRGAVNAAGKLQGQPVIPEDAFAQIMGSLPQLQSLNEDLLRDLVERIDRWEEKKGLIADVIARKGPFLKLYTSYFCNYENMIAMYDEACKKYPAFAKVVTSFEKSDKCEKLALKHYLVKPVQRIPQYRLLLQEYLKHLDESSPDYQNAINALKVVSEVADHANKTLKIGDNFAKLVEIQGKAATCEIVKPGRIFVKEGELLKLSRRGLQPRFFFLFNDGLLHTTVVTPSLLRIHHELPIAGMKVTVPTNEEYRNEFSIISVSRSFTISASSPLEKEEWMEALNRVIDENAQRRGTFINARLQRRMSQEKMSLRDTLGRQAPVWVADARVTMCQLCASYFTLTFRRHHCRACGKVVCALCSANRVPLEYLQLSTARVCDDCFVVLQKEVKDGGDLKKDCRRPLPRDLRPPTREPSKKRRILRRLVPNALQQVHANDEGSSASGYLHKWVKRSWKKLWFVVKDNVIYSYMASEDVVALESTPILGFKVVRLNTAFEGIHAQLVIRLEHGGHPPLVFYAGSLNAAEKWRKAMEEATVL